VSNTIIEAGKVVFFHYTLTNDAAETIDSSRGGDPLPYLHGAGNIVPGLEKQLEGHPVGAKLQATVQPKEGYGERAGEPMPVPRDQFPEGVNLQPGMQFMAQDPNGTQFPLWIAAVDGETVLVDPNHPLAGATLHFDVEIMSIRDASDEEKEHGHPHMPGMHDH
jgi:FKBP-type peptidyl-prolyl cis-trans isomerase SlyD